MSKSILVIDTPKDCKSCPFCRGLNVCKIMKYIKRERILSSYTLDYQIFEGGKPDWCPLKDVPEKTNPPSQYPYLHRLIADGWNACIDTILKDTNEKN